MVSSERSSRPSNHEGGLTGGAKSVGFERQILLFFRAPGKKIQRSFKALIRKHPEPEPHFALGRKSSRTMLLALTEGGLGRRPNTSGCQGSWSAWRPSLQRLNDAAEEASRNWEHGPRTCAGCEAKRTAEALPPGTETGGSRGGIGPFLTR